MLLGPPEACTCPELLGGGGCAFLSPCSQQGGKEKSRPAFLSLLSLHNGFLCEGLGRLRRRERWAAVEYRCWAQSAGAADWGVPGRAG